MTAKRKVQPADYAPQFDFVGVEKDIESHILDNIHEIAKQCGWPKIKTVERQFVLRFYDSKISKRGVADLFIVHEDDTTTLIEVKKSRGGLRKLMTAISQLLFYGHLAKSKFSALPRLVFACNIIDKPCYDVVKSYNLPICFMMVDGNRCIYLEG